MERRASRFRESIDSAETGQWDNSAMDPALSLVSSNTEDIISGPEALAATRPQAGDEASHITGDNSDNSDMGIEIKLGK